jgi:transposase
MIGLRPGLSIWIATQPVDFRRGMDSLAMLVSEAFGADPFDGGLYVFRSKRRDRVKILTWDGSGLVLRRDRRQAARRSGGPWKATGATQPGEASEHLPRIDVVIDIESHTCPCCGEQLHKIGETVKEAFDVIPMQYRVKRIVRPRYGCRGCRQGVLQAPAPAQAIDGGMVTEALLADIAVMKYGYQLPLYRQEQMFAAQGITLDRQTLASWMGRVAWWLKPLHALLRRAVMSYPRLFGDETPLPVLDLGRGRTKVCQLWAIATDDRPWSGPAPPAVVYMFAEDRKAIGARQLFGDYDGILQIDGYATYKGLIKNGGRLVQLAFCFAHARRKFWDVHVATKSPIAAEALQRIAMFYAIEDRIRGLPGCSGLRCGKPTPGR